MSYAENHILNEDQAHAALDEALKLCRRIDVVPASIHLRDNSWRAKPAVDVSIIIESNDLNAGVIGDRTQALMRVARCASRLARLGEVAKNSGDYSYTLSVKKELEVLGSFTQFDLDVHLVATMSVDMVCEMVPVLDDDGEPVVEEFETEEATYHKVTKTRPVTQKVCPPSLLAALQ